MENAEVDEGEDMINLDDDGRIRSSFNETDLVVMDAKEFLDRMDQQRIDFISYSPKEQEDEQDDEQDDSDEIHRDSVCVRVGSLL